MPIIDRVGDYANVARDRRRALGMSQAELAELIGRSRQWVSSFDSGAVTNPGRPDVIRVAHELYLKLDLAADRDAEADRPDD